MEISPYVNLAKLFPLSAHFPLAKSGFLQELSRLQRGFFDRITGFLFILSLPSIILTRI